jgi:predicted DNA-binding transcriptional regulator AlpA
MTQTNHVPPAPMALRAREAAQALSISIRHLWALTKVGDIPHIRLGHGRRQIILYPTTALREWLARQTSPTSDLK